MLRERAALFVICLGFWLVFSGQLDALHLAAGVLSAALVAALARDLARLGTRTDARGRRVPVFTFSIPWPRFALYLPWLLWEMILANLQIAYVILHPRLPISPTLVRFRTRLPGDLGRTTFANSITLTPGTITVDVEGDEFVVHALTRSGAEDLLTREMERRVARALGPV
jgi:multicomponent Na+:H+ antiporter subunit E